MLVDMKSDVQTRISLVLCARLGEGLHWDTSTQRLWGVDIHGMHLWCWDLSSHTPQVWTLAQRVGWVLPTAQAGKLLLGMQGGFALADSADPTRFEWLHQPFLHNLALRSNDAKADATGAVWAGSVNNDDESRPEGCLYRLGPGGDLAVADTGYTVANGPAINADNTLMLHTDSGRRTIYAFDLDAPAGTLTNKRVWKMFTEDEGYPDGMCFDAQGCVWVAHWGAGCVSRFAPSGVLLRRVSLPTSNVTNVCFAGPDLDRIFVTTAQAGLSPLQLSAQPQAGALFEVAALGATGLPGLPAGIGRK